MKLSAIQYLMLISCTVVLNSAGASDPRDRVDERFVCSEDLWRQPVLQPVQAAVATRSSDDELPSHACLYHWDIWARGVAPAAGGGNPAGPVSAPTLPIPATTLPGSPLVQALPPLLIPPPGGILPPPPPPPPPGMP